MTTTTDHTYCARCHTEVTNPTTHTTTSTYEGWLCEPCAAADQLADRLRQRLDARNHHAETHQV